LVFTGIIILLKIPVLLCIVIAMKWITFGMIQVLGWEEDS